MSVFLIFFFRLLHDNPDLYQLYKDLVVGDIITAEEFWANRANGQVKPCLLVLGYVNV
jgi:hypothetical protein